MATGTIAFFALCARRAWAGSWALANNLAATVGGFLMVVLAWKLGLTMEAPTSVEGAIAFTLAGTAGAILLVWTLIFVVRFVLSPAQLYRKSEIQLRLVSEELAALKAASPLEILYDPNDAEKRFVLYENAMVVSINAVHQMEDPHAISYVFGVRNNKSDQTIRDMHVVISGDDIVRLLPLSRGFQPRDLHPGVTELYPLLTVREGDFEQNKIHDPYNSLNKSGHFTIRARGQDTKEAVARFKYDPSTIPHIVML
jgi:hypothetical protein